ncbi:hypothetical protein RF11_09114 [Thelohanellus kitauei]|uniref:Uncharacterized protein n=1 Tax=Thelohanellus kitauei TaxID=669202 RepID=A0A0C2JVE7_THEKT|nr:hypothetical protein RF11_09114 [Thelohanellus kitauei]
MADSVDQEQKAIAEQICKLLNDDVFINSDSDQQNQLMELLDRFSEDVELLQAKILVQSSVVERIHNLADHIKRCQLQIADIKTFTPPGFFDVNSKPKIRRLDVSKLGQKAAFGIHFIFYFISLNRTLQQRKCHSPQKVFIHTRLRA